MANGTLKATRLRNVRVFRQDNAAPIDIYSLDYYWFVGHDDQTPSHLERTWIDVRDRVLKGENQQWAYITVISTITKGLQSLGRSESETDEMIRDFIRALGADLQTTSVRKRSSS